MDCLKAKEKILKNLVSEFNLCSLDIDITFYETKLKKSCPRIIDQLWKRQVQDLILRYKEIGKVYLEPACIVKNNMLVQLRISQHLPD